MPRGLNRSGGFRNGFLITLPHNFGNNVTLSNTTTAGTTPSGFQLEDGSGVILLEDGTVLLLEAQ